MPKSAATHIQKIAPGPPIARAPATPAMLPVPTVPARAVVSAWTGVSVPLLFPFSFLPKRRPTVFFMMKGKRAN